MITGGSVSCLLCPHSHLHVLGVALCIRVLNFITCFAGHANKRCSKQDFSTHGCKWGFNHFVDSPFRLLPFWVHARGPYSVHSGVILCPGVTSGAYSLLPAACQNQSQAEIHCALIYAHSNGLCVQGYGCIIMYALYMMP